jgi:hypothetical protein
VSEKKVCETCGTPLLDTPKMGLQCKCSLEMNIENSKIAMKYREATLERPQVKSSAREKSAIQPDQDGENPEAEEATFTRSTVVRRSNIRIPTGKSKKGTIKQKRNTPRTELFTDFAMDYPMDRQERGFHLIFAQENFAAELGLDKREGTEADVKALEKAYSHLGFENKVFRDKSVEEIRLILRDYSRWNLSDHDCIAVTMLTHGNLVELFARDGSFPADEVWQPFQADKCTTLHCKPKIFICQACKGTDKNPGAEAKELNLDGLRVATMSDFIWGYSTFRGDVSYRHTKTGSIYIQALCNVILRDSNRSMHFASILTEANNETNEYFNQPGFEKYMQCSNFTTTLRGKVKFPIKYESTLNEEALATSLPEDESDEEISQKLANTSLASSQVPSTAAKGTQSVHATQNTRV